MKLENQFCTPEQSKSLIELGIDASLANYLWHRLDVGEWSLIDKIHLKASPPTVWAAMYECCPAFSLAELFAMHPFNSTTLKWEHLGEWEFSTPKGSEIKRKHPTQAQCLAQELIYFLDGRTKVAAEKCNERLKNA